MDKAGGDPNKWIDVKSKLLRNGAGNPKFADGKSSFRSRDALVVHYVNSIRRYYDLLVWLGKEEESGWIASS
jgi:membrane-bound lytic murein transglycosylase F